MAKLKRRATSPTKEKVTKAAAPAKKPVKAKKSAGKGRGRPNVSRANVQKAHDERSQTGKYKSYIKPEYLGSVWSPGKATHLISILPTWDTEAGEWSFFHRVYAHGQVGVNEDNYICLARMFNQRCFICEQYAEYISECESEDKEPDEKKVRALRPSQRIIYNIRVVTDSRTEDEGNKLYLAPVQKIHNEILELCKDPRTGEIINVANLDEGMDVQFTKEGEGLQTQYKGVRLVDREPIPDEWVEDLVVLDQSYHIPDYEEVKNVFLGAPSEEEEAEGEEAEEDDVPVDVGEEGEEGEEVEDVGEDDDPEEYGNDPEDDEEGEEEEAVEEEPPPPPRRSSRAPARTSAGGKKSLNRRGR